MRVSNLHIFIAHERLIQTFLSETIVRKLVEKFKLIIYLAPTVEIPKKDLETIKTKFNVIQLRENKFASKLQLLSLDCTTFSEKNRSISFESRIRKNLLIPRSIPLKVISLTKAGGVRGFLVGVSRIRVLGKILQHSIQKFSVISSSVVRQISGIDQSDQVLILTGGAFGGIENVILRWTNKKFINSVMIVDNWDNLSSKSMYSYAPSIVGVWGKSMEGDALNIQGFQKETIRIIGSSRVDMSEKNNVNLEHPYILFCGSGWKFSNEFDLVTKVSKAISINHPLYRVVYRPHPAYLTSEKIQDYENMINSSTNLMLDSNVIHNYGIRNLYSQESLIQAEQLIRNARIVLAGHSTMIVEALYYGRKTICYSGSDDLYLARNNAWDSYHHMAQLRGSLGLIETTTTDDFIGQILLEMESIDCESSGENFVPDIIPNFSSSYSDRIIGLLGEVEKR